MISRRVGDARVTLFNSGDLRANLASWLKLSAADWAGRYDAIFAAPFPVPVQSVHIQTPELSVLVDPSVYHVPRGSAMALPGYRPPPPLWEQMETTGLTAGGVNAIVITHVHFDHFSGLTRDIDGEPRPAFPNARVYLGRADWEAQSLQRLLARPASLESQTLGVVQQHGLLVVSGASLNLGHGVSLLPAPGETPGHQIVRLERGGQALYCLGDLFHHPVEVEQPDWVCHWNNRRAALTSRRRLVDAALREDALLTATHIPGFGRLEETPAGSRWVEVRA